MASNQQEEELARKLTKLINSAANSFVTTLTAPELKQRVTVTTPGNDTVSAIALSPISGRCLVFQANNQWYAIATAQETAIEDESVIVNRHKRPIRAGIPICQLVPVSIWRARKRLIPLDQRFRNISKIIDPYPNVSYSVSANGICFPRVDGGGEYVTGEECLLDNIQPIPIYTFSSNFGGDSGFANSDAEASQGEDEDDLVRGAGASFVIEYLPYIDVDPELGAITNLNYSGLVPENTFRLYTILTTVDPNGVWAEIEWFFPGTSETFIRTFTLESSYNAGDIREVIDGNPQAATGFTFVSDNYMEKEYAITNFTGLAALPDLGISISDLSISDVPDTTPEQGTPQFVRGFTQVNLAISLNRNTFVDIAQGRNAYTYIIKFHDPDLPPINLNDFVDNFETNVLVGYFVYLLDKAYIYIKRGKVRNPELDYEDRFWARIEVTEFDLSSGQAEVSTAIYNYPETVPILKDNPISEITNVYTDGPISDPCSADNSHIDYQILLSPNYQTNEITLQQGVKKIIEFRTLANLVQVAGGE